MKARKVATNKKAFRDYFIVDQWECGIALSGSEVKSIRDDGINFKDSFARIEGNEIFLYNLHINPYVQASYLNLEADRKRKLLLHKNEIKKILGRMTQRGLALIPTKIYFNARNFVKVEIGLVKGKKLFDKRETIKKRDLDKQVDRAVRSYKPRS
ncbi:MAG: SsrA-binding protein SmpB [Candidatus Omnitrophica bacterium]|nr:SsrA-binding protein SmpB [Candidatus Omnitrophota bacterium]